MQFGRASQKQPEAKSLTAQGFYTEKSLNTLRLKENLATQASGHLPAPHAPNRNLLGRSQSSQVVKHKQNYHDYAAQHE
jgi:hypothetical protein